MKSTRVHERDDKQAEVALLAKGRSSIERTRTELGGRKESFDWWKCLGPRLTPIIVSLTQRILQAFLKCFKVSHWQ